MSKYFGRKVTVVPDYYKDLNNMSNNDTYGNCLLASNVHSYVHSMSIRFDSVSNPYKCVNGYIKVDLIFRKVVTFRMFFKDEATMDNVLSLLNPTDQIDEFNEFNELQDFDLYYMTCTEEGKFNVYEKSSQDLVATVYKEDLVNTLLSKLNEA